MANSVELTGQPQGSTRWPLPRSGIFNSCLPVSPVGHVRTTVTQLGEYRLDRLASFSRASRPTGATLLYIAHNPMTAVWLSPSGSMRCSANRRFNQVTGRRWLLLVTEVDAGAVCVQAQVVTFEHPGARNDEGPNGEGFVEFDEAYFAARGPQSLNGIRDRRHRSDSRRSGRNAGHRQISDPLELEAVYSDISASYRRRARSRVFSLHHWGSQEQGWLTRKAADGAIGSFCRCRL